MCNFVCSTKDLDHSINEEDAILLLGPLNAAWSWVNKMKTNLFVLLTHFTKLIKDFNSRLT